MTSGKIPLYPAPIVLDSTCARYSKEQDMRRNKLTQVASVCVALLWSFQQEIQIHTSRTRSSLFETDLCLRLNLWLNIAKRNFDPFENALRWKMLKW